jgi:hypothetical protein
MEDLLTELIGIMLLHERLMAEQRIQIEKLTIEIQEMKRKLSAIEKLAQTNRNKLK